MVNGAEPCVVQSSGADRDHGRRSRQPGRPGPRPAAWPAAWGGVYQFSPRRVLFKNVSLAHLLYGIELYCVSNATVRNFTEAGTRLRQLHLAISDPRRVAVKVKR